MNSLYPLKFRTIFKDKIWGGQKIKQVLNKDFSPLPNCGETWEISGVPGNVSVVNNGVLAGKSLNELISTYKEKLLGKQVFEKYGEQFPLLVKLIDANDDLSIQVHPNDELAQKRHNSFGKTEMWYILQADEGASLITGFNQPVDQEKYVRYFEAGKLTEILNREPVQAEDLFFIPAGRVHTIGKGILLAEIQQTSDVTYRIYDFDRVDDKGQKRDLHVEEALDAIDYNFYNQYKTDYPKKLNSPVEMVSCPYFTTNRLHFSHSTSRNYSDIDSFIIYVCYEGRVEIGRKEWGVELKAGEVALLPAAVKEVSLETDTGFKLLESYVPR
ncbi:MAG: type I phosphomannose isomerase catalytic subunit [Cyclobacteriaceae bacterium]